MPTYDTTVDSAAENNSHALMLRLVPAAGRVLDVGCATGYLGAALIDQGCTVAGVELDPEAAERASAVLEDVLVADLETVDLAAHFGTESFDTVVLGDVLEHLRDPLRLLRAAMPLLRRGGSVVISVPNVAHGDLRLALLQGRWEYRDRGLLDRTHLQFFTRTSLIQMLADAGLVAVDLQRTTAPLLQTELDVDAGRLPDGVLEWAGAQAEATTYQFVVRAVRDDADGVVRQVVAERDELRLRMQEEGGAAAARLAELESELSEVRAQAAELESELDAVRAQAAELTGQVGAVQAEVDRARLERERIAATLTMRTLDKPRQMYGWVRGRLGQ